MQLPLPRIKLKWSNQTSLSLPLTPSGAESLKRALLSAGQEREAGEDGAPETRLPWAVRPGEDFRVVNCAVWKKVVTGIVEKVQKYNGIILLFIVRLPQFYRQNGSVHMLPRARVCTAVQQQSYGK